MNEHEPYSDEELPVEEPPRPLPRKIFIGAILIILGIYLILHNFGLLKPWDFVQHLPVALIILGILRIWIKGLFNPLAQTMIIFGILMHIAFLGLQAAIDYSLPALVIWAGSLFLIKGILIWRKSKDGEDEEAPQSIYDWKPPEGEGSYGSESQAGTKGAEDDAEPPPDSDSPENNVEPQIAAIESENPVEGGPED
jgi:hypothetical protein